MIRIQALGLNGEDNALLVEVDSGDNLSRVLCDCGHGSLEQVSPQVLRHLDHLVISHFHMDHISGFDQILRLTFDRLKPLCIWGPPDTMEVIGHRLLGFTWNMTQDCPGSVEVHEIGETEHRSATFFVSDAYRTPCRVETKPFHPTKSIWENERWSLRGMLLDHGIPTLAVAIEEPISFHVDVGAMQRLGLSPGPWCRQLKNWTGAPVTMTVEDTVYSVQELYSQIITRQPGQKIAYITDTVWDETLMKDLVAFVSGTDCLVCEAMYLQTDEELASKNKHLTGEQAARVACAAEAQRLILLHLSDRYTDQQSFEILRQARQLFPNTDFPDHWNIVGA